VKIKGDLSSKQGKTTLRFSSFSVSSGKGPKNACGELGQGIITGFPDFVFSFLYVWFYDEWEMTTWNFL